MVKHDPLFDLKFSRFGLQKILLNYYKLWFLAITGRDFIVKRKNNYILSSRISLCAFQERLSTAIFTGWDIIFAERIEFAGNG